MHEQRSRSLLIALACGGLLSACSAPEPAALDNPFDPTNAALDDDNDGVSNGEEVAAGTDPELEDSDGDGLSDKEEIDQELDPTATDSDGDGLDDPDDPCPAAVPGGECLSAGVCAAVKPGCPCSDEYGLIDSYEADSELSCDGLDNDCDGNVDDPDDLEAPLADNQQGVCEGVIKVCGAENGWQEPDYADQREGFEAELELSCDGLDNDCDGGADDADDLQAPPADNQQGVCEGVVKVCQGEGGWQEPDYAAAVGDSYQPGDEHSCDGLNNDCDEETDEGDPQGGDPCDTGLLGVCASGVRHCVDGKRECVPEQEPSEAELCDGLDNTCDGDVDEGEPESGDVCDTGGLGACAAGTTSCREGQISCEQNAPPSEEACDGVDNDCDGFADLNAPCDGGRECVTETDAEGVVVAASCDCPTPGEGINFQSCGEPATCVDLQSDPQNCGRCNRACEDAVCDQGVCGESCAEGREPCEGACLDLGSNTDHCGACGSSCARPGVNTRCSFGQCEVIEEDGCLEGYANPDGDLSNGCECQLSNGGQELCDGLDNDCDGVIDNDNPGAGAACPTGGVGACGQGLTACVDGALRCEADPDLAAADDDTSCDGLDDDCDGSVDEDASCAGEQLCRDGACGCPADAPTACGELCADTASDPAHCGACDTACGDGAVCERGQCVDGCGNDATECGGACVDTGVNLQHCGNCDSPCEHAGAISACDAGACALVRCRDGNVDLDGDISNGCECRQTGAEVCDGIDNDCDGVVDDGFVLSRSEGESLSWGEACEGVGECGEGSVECANGTTLRCSSDPGGSEDGSEEELCDAVDNDCDGVTDDGFVLSRTEGESLAWGEDCDGIGECGSGNVECADEATLRCSTDPDGSAPEDENEICDALDNDCDGVTDNGFALDRDGGELSWGEDCDGIGACGSGTVECSDDATLTCSTDANGSEHQDEEETCDLLDNDCDGVINNGFVLDRDELELSWGTDCDGIGECGSGTVECADEASLTCSTDANGTESGVQPESCDLLDNDCDGVINNGLVLSRDGQELPWDAPCDGIGECGAGSVECVDEDSLRCSSDPDGTDDDSDPEICDGLDNDCDGLVNNGLVLVRDDQELAWSTDCDGIGECGAGTVVCRDDENLSCSSDVDGSEELCDGLDNDCDGEADEEFSLPSPGGAIAIGESCPARTPACAPGTVECANQNRAICSVWPGGSEFVEEEEICDGRDNDCDRLTDEGFTWRGIAVDDRCEGDGFCGRAVVECLDERTAVCATMPGGSLDQSRPERCNEIDDDCDRLTDEGFDLEQDCTAGVGACEANGIVACAEDGHSACFVENPPARQDEVFNCIDDDCDGDTDEDLDADDPDELCGEGLVTVGYYGTWCGKVNSHAKPDGVWLCDNDGSSGCDNNTVAYCQKFWPEVTEQVALPAPLEPRDFWNVNCNQLSVGGGEAQYACCAPAPDPTECDTGLDGICSVGALSCAEGEDGELEQVCEAATEEEIFEICGDNLDTDCDGVHDEGCNGCVDGTRVRWWEACIPDTGADGFEMGSPANEPGRGVDETQHTVVQTRQVIAWRSEMIQYTFDFVTDTNPSFNVACGDLCPVERVTFWDALGMLNAYSLLAGFEPCYELSGCDGNVGAGYDCDSVSWPKGLDCEGYRLPTEAEWEWMSRAGTTTAYYNGSMIAPPFQGVCSSDLNLRDIAWYCVNSDASTQPRWQMDGNDWGLYDTAGNVWEWVWDVWLIYGDDDVTVDPIGPDNGARRGVRGCSKGSPHYNCRSAERIGISPGDSYVDVGFRAVRTHPDFVRADDGEACHEDADCRPGLACIAEICEEAN